jgi:DNA-binding LytR/AlgR family response regulator
MFELFDNMKKKKTRLIVQRGIENIALKVDDIALIYTENKLVFVVAKDERKYQSWTTRYSSEPTASTLLTWSTYVGLRRMKR